MENQKGVKLARERIEVKAKRETRSLKLPRTWACWATGVSLRERAQIINSAEDVYRQKSGGSRFLVAEAILINAGRIEKGGGKKKK